MGGVHGCVAWLMPRRLHTASLAAALRDCGPDEWIAWNDLPLRQYTSLQMVSDTDCIWLKRSQTAGGVPGRENIAKRPASPTDGDAHSPCLQHRRLQRCN